MGNISLKHEECRAIKPITPLKLAMAIFGLLLIFTMIAGLALANSRVHAEQTCNTVNGVTTCSNYGPPPVAASNSATASVTVSTACTMSGDGNNFVGTVPGGSTIEFGSGTANDNGGENGGSSVPIKVVCNDPLGFSIYAIGYTNNTYGNNQLVSAAGSINAGNSSSAGGNSYWAMRLNPVTGIGQDYPPIIAGSSTDPNKQTGDTDYSSYAAVPNVFTKVAYRTSYTDIGESATGSSLYTNYQVHASGSQAPGTYAGAVKYTMVHPNAMMAGTYTINYYANGGTGTMESETTYNFTPHILAAFSTDDITPPEGYGFVGWCSIQDNTATSSNPQTTCEGDNYDDEGIVEPSTVDAGGTLNLYAVWGKNYTVNFYSNPYQVDNTPLLVTIRGRTYAKTNSGNALVAYMDNFWATDSSLRYSAPILVSQNQSAVTYTTGGGYDSTNGSSGSFVYDGITYYLSSTDAWHWSGGTIVPAVATKEYDDMAFANIAQQLVADSKANLNTQTFTYGVEQNLRTNTYTRDGFSFVGWSTTPTGDVLYTDGESVSNLTTSGSIDLYAIWSLNYMQDVTLQQCTADGLAAYDNRDYEIYNIRRLADNKCWMLDNLRLGSNSDAITLTSANSNINGATYTLPQGVTSGFNTYTSAQINAAYKNDTATSYGNGSGKVGVYYNYCAASAGTICSSSNSSNASYDICPVGWGLPVVESGGLGGDYSSLCNAYYGSTCSLGQAGFDLDSASSPNYNFGDVRSGRFLDAAQFDLNVAGRFWSSTRYNRTDYAPERADTSMFILYLNGNAFYIGDYGSRNYGISMRCILK